MLGFGAFVKSFFLGPSVKVAPSAVMGQERTCEPWNQCRSSHPQLGCVCADTGMRQWGCSALFGFSGLPSGPAHQVGSLPRPVQHLPYQAFLHLQHPHHPAVGPGVQPIRHLPDVVSPLQWQPAGQPAGHLVCKYGCLKKSVWMLWLVTVGCIHVSSLWPNILPKDIFSPCLFPIQHSNFSFQ